MKLKKTMLALSLSLLLPVTQVFAQSTTYTVQPGDTMWKIAVKYETGISEIIAANPQVKNPSMIYPGQKINIPNADSLKAQEDEVVRLVNVERAKAGLQPLKSNWQAARVARYKADDMLKNNYFSHISPTYGSPFDMMKSFGLQFSAAGENIAEGQRTPQEVMDAWMNSPGHKANILSPAYTEIGVGAAKASTGGLIWVQEFIKPLY
jgi:uncharacterized YkwD family protein/spore coat assembly protein SafA